MYSWETKYRLADTDHQYSRTRHNNNLILTFQSRFVKHSVRIFAPTIGIDILDAGLALETVAETNSD